VWVGPLVVKELKRIVEASEITKYAFFFPFAWINMLIVARREDDTNWPKKNIVGKQELEIRVGNDHIAFEVLPTPLPHERFRANVFPARPPKSARWLTSRTARIQKGFVCFTTLSRTSRSVRLVVFICTIQR
jgi:hypothetical protein